VIYDDDDDADMDSIVLPLLRCIYLYYSKRGKKFYFLFICTPVQHYANKWTPVSLHVHTHRGGLDWNGARWFVRSLLDYDCAALLRHVGTSTVTYTRQTFRNYARVRALTSVCECFICQFHRSAIHR
jgi:hypothetical protein